MSYVYSNQYVPINAGYSYGYNPQSSFKMNYIQPSAMTKLQTPVHRGNFPYGINAEINFYDPVTGRPGPVVNTFPQVQQMLNRPAGYDVNISGDIRDISRIDEIISNNKGKNLIDNNNTIFDPSDENLRKISNEIDQNNNNNKNYDLDKMQFHSPVSVSGNYYDVENVNRLLYGNYNNSNNNNQNNNYTTIYNPSDNNLQALTNKLQNNVPRQNIIRQTTNLIDYNAMPNSNWRMHGDLLVHPSLTTTYTGSGVIISEKGYKHNGVPIPTIILCQEQNDEFGDFGGMIDTFQPGATDNTLAFNAKDKLYRESYGFFNLNSQLFNFTYLNITVDPNASTFYRCFFIAVDGDLLKLDNQQLSDAFKNNLSLMKNANNKKSISRFNLIDLLNSININNNNSTNKVIVKDLNGNSVVLSNRIVNILRELKKNKSKINSIYTDIVPSNYYKTSNGLQTIVI